jgi:hypothetical protein
LHFTAVPPSIFVGSPTRSQAERTGWEGPPPTKFYELRDNLAFARTGITRDDHAGVAGC